MRSDVLSRGGGWAIVLIGAAVCPVVMQAQLPTWVIDSAARPVLKQLWASSIAARTERVACLAGRIAPDTVWITDAMPLAGSADSLGADSLGAGAEASLAECGPPRWIGTVHTHIRSTDDPEPVARFSPGDRAVMSTWATRWGRKGAFCILHSATAAHCEVYPAGTQARQVAPP